MRYITVYLTCKPPNTNLQYMHDPLKTWMLTPTTMLFMFSFTKTSHQLPKETNALTCAKPIP